MMMPPLAELQADLAANADPSKREWWSRYLKGEAEFRGVPTPDIRRLSNDWWERHDGDALAAPDQLETCLARLRCTLTEDKLAGMLLLADWNAVDWFCVRVLGPHIAASGETCATAVAGWVEETIMWQRRSALVAFVNLAPSGAYADLIIETAARLVDDPARFAQTGVAWVIRGLSGSRPDLTEPFLERHAGQMSPEAQRQARGRRRR